MLTEYKSIKDHEYLHEERGSRITANPVQKKNSLTSKNSFSYNLANSLNGKN